MNSLVRVCVRSRFVLSDTRASLDKKEDIVDQETSDVAPIPSVDDNVILTAENLLRRKCRSSVNLRFLFAFLTQKQNKNGFFNTWPTKRRLCIQIAVHETGI